MKKINTSIFADLMLLLVAIIWGTGFIATQYAIDAKMSTSLIMAIRFLIASLILFIAFFKDIIRSTKKEILHGSVAGVMLFFAFYLQTFGQAHTTVSNNAFLTSTNVIMVPFIVWAITKKRPAIKTFILTGITLIGISVLTNVFINGFSFGVGDLLTLLCAFIFALHIAYLGIVCKDLNPKRTTFWQISVAGLISIAVLLIFDNQSIQIEQFANGFLPVLYLGIFSTCVCYFIQTKAQTHTTPSKTGMILSTEGLFGSIFSVLIGFEDLSIHLIAGGIIITLSVIASEFDIKEFIKKKNK